jgi:DNA (cytosine-5)-methyltransferase 1
MVAHPTPQSRDRWYVVFWQGIPTPDLEIRPACWCSTCEATVEGIQTWKRPDARWGKYRQQYTYSCPTCQKQVLPWVWPAASAIDWGLPCERIGDRARPLAPATRRRIEVGLERYGPAVVQAAGNTYERAGYYRTWPAWEPLKTLSSTNQFGLALPGFIMDAANTGSAAKYDGSRVRHPREPLFTETASNRNALVVPVHHGGSGPSAYPPEHPHLTQSGRQETGLVIMNTGSIDEAKYRAYTSNDPMHTVVGSSINQSLVTLPFIAELRGGGSDASSVADPLATVTGSGTHHGLTVPPGMLVRMNGGMADADCMATPADGPMGTLTGKAHQGVVPFLTPYYGNSTPSPVDAPAPTVTAVDRCGLVEPSIAVDDCGFRMLEPPEAGLGMGFPSTYVVGGSKRDQVRQYGQAVTPPASAVLLGRIFEAMS